MADPGDKGGLVIVGVILVAGGLLFFLIQCKFHVPTRVNERRKGEKLTVLYEPADPRNVWEERPSMKSTLIGLAVSAVAVALGVALIFLFGRQRQAHV